ncbi:MAG: UbiA family prenyltransferase [Gemmatimonadaceae bacterium]
MTSTAVIPDRGLGRWWVYQRERFPLVAHAPLIAAFSSAAVCLSALLRGERYPQVASLVAAFVTALCFFFQLRVADEFKDAEDDARHRPYRPVPRGLVTLRELGWLAAAAAGIQLVVATWLSARMIPFLLLVWGYMALMSKEFFVRDWLRARPVTVLWSHMLIMPLIDLYATACDWVPAGAAMAAGLRWFLVASFFNGLVVEVGRKIRSPDAEEPGVETYTVLWGRTRAVGVWVAVMAVALGSAVLAAGEVGSGPMVGVVLGTVWITSVIAGAAFVARPTRGRARLVEPLAGVWTLAMYVAVGIVPVLVRTR